MDTKLKDLLLERKSAILGKWFDELLKTYPADTAPFLKSQKNRFINPVGSIIFRGMEKLFEKLLDGSDSDLVSQAAPVLDSIIRIRAVQDISPSQAVSFILILKKVLREELKKDVPGEDRIAEDLLALESKIDALALLSFDIYMNCREKIYELKVKELQNWTFRRLQRADAVSKHEFELKYNIETLERKEVAQ